MKIGNFNFGECLSRRVLLLFVLVGMVVLVGAVSWVGSDVIYYLNEDSPYYHNLSANVTGFNSDITFAIDTQTDINWTNGSGSYLVVADVVSSWLFVENSTNGNLSINASLDNQTGFFIVPIQANNASGDDTITNFEFQINATNDAPYFTDINSSYDFPQDGGEDYLISALDEEQHYPLDFNLTFYNCTHAAWSGRTDGENCSIFNLTYDSESSTNFSFSPEYDDVGTYYAYFTVSDFNGTCPHSYCDVSSYEENQSSEIYNLTFNVYSVLTIDASNCTGASISEGETFNCTVDVMTKGETGELNFSSYGFFSNNSAMSYDETNRDWFHGDFEDNASNFFYSLPVSVTPEKKEVGNWTINFSVQEGSDIEVGQIEIFVNYTESNVSLDVISNLTLYENGSFDVNAYDDDLLIWDSSVKYEVLTLVSNYSWVIPGSAITSSGDNYSSFTVEINHTDALASLGIGNYSVNISVNDSVGNVDSRIFVVEVLNESAPVWNVSLDDPVVLELPEDSLFSYNVSVNVSDPGENISFYYENISEEFCSLTASNFNSSSGVINFTPADCDVGYHNVTIISGNGKLNSSWSFVFNISNVADVLTINTFTGDNGTQEDLDEGFNFIAPEAVASNFSLVINDDDFLIPDGQESYYNESLTVSVTFTNSTGGSVDLFNFSFLDAGYPSDESVRYTAMFTPEVEDVGNYIVFVNLTDASGNSINRTWNLSVTEDLEPPILELVENVSLTIHDYLNFSLNATDEEDGFNELNLSYFIVALDSSAPDLNVSEERIEFNMSSNQSLSGKWGYNVSVTDNDSMVDWQVFYLFAYGPAWNISVLEDFTLEENTSSVLNFTINHSVGDNLTYEFWIDDVSCWFTNATLNCSYGNLSLRENVSGVGNGSVLGWDFTPDFEDETYGLLKNLTVIVYPSSANLTENQSSLIARSFNFSLNISHENAPMRKIEGSTATLEFSGYSGEIDLSDFFYDEDVDDPYYSQNISFSESSVSDNIYLTHTVNSGWIANVGVSGSPSYPHEGYIYVLGNDSLTSDVSAEISLKFTAPETTTAPSSGGSGSTSVKFYSIRIVVPDDVIISDEDYIDVPFRLENSGTIDLSGIDLSSEVLYNNEFSDDVKIDLGVDYIDSLKVGESREFTMRILADTDRSGKYKATLFANVSSPKFNDWGDFFINLRRVNESEAEKLLVFTEKIISDNPECLELVEVFRRAREVFEAGNIAEAMRMAEEVSSACEDAINANEQVSYRIEGFVESSFYYISFVTLAMFFMGLIFYVYKRMKFNKPEVDSSL